MTRGQNVQLSVDRGRDKPLPVIMPHYIADYTKLLCTLEKFTNTYFGLVYKNFPKITEMNTFDFPVHPSSVHELRI